MCSVFIRRGGSITCTVNGSRRYSADLPQGGLELPCKLMFIAPSLLECNKMENWFNLHYLEPQNEPANNEAAAISKSTEPSGHINNASEQELTSQENIMAVDSIMCSPPKTRSKTFDEEAIVMGNELTNNIIVINFAQCLLKAQFKNVRGLESTLLQERNSTSLISKDAIENRIQILFCKERKHWMVATTINCATNKVKVYDSLFQYLDRDSVQLVEAIFQCGGMDPQIKMIQCRKQTGVKDCGIFAIAFATAIAHRLNLIRQNINQQAMRAHLVDCFNNKLLAPFPCK